MKILVTGATGFIGQKLIRVLSNEGHSLVVLARNPAKARETLKVPLEAFAWDAEKEIAPRQSLEGVEAVIHLAGEGIAEKRWTEKQKKKIRYSRVLGTRNLLDGMRNMGERHPGFLFVLRRLVTTAIAGTKTLTRRRNRAPVF